MLIVRGIGGVLVASVVALGCGGKALQVDSTAAGKDSQLAFGGGSMLAIIGSSEPVAGSTSADSGGESAGGSASGDSGVGAAGGSANGAAAGTSVSGAGSSSGGSGSSGLGGSSDAGSIGAAGARDTSTCSDGDYPPFECVGSCAEQGSPVTLPICDNQHWRCAGSTQSVLDCAPNACAVLTQTCCDPILGNIRSLCGADGRYAPCAPGQIPNTLICAPASVGVGGCASLAGTPCTLVNAGCNGGARLVCSCESAETGLADPPLTWMCSVVPG